VPRGQGPVAVLAKGKEDRRAQIDALRSAGPDDEQRFAEYLNNSYADATSVLHNGKRIYEAYYEQMPAENSHIIWSMVGLLATQLIHQGRLDVQAGQRVVVAQGTDQPASAVRYCPGVALNA
jgi:hypothetical protein